MPCSEFGDTLIIIATMREHPTIGRARQSLCLKPLAVIGDVARNPTLQVVAVVGGENFASGAIVSKMCHSHYPSFFYTHIIPQNYPFVNT
jgi:hypothetical protein